MFLFFQKMRRNFVFLKKRPRKGTKYLFMNGRLLSKYKTKRCNVTPVSWAEH